MRRFLLRLLSLSLQFVLLLSADSSHFLQAAILTVLSGHFLEMQMADTAQTLLLMRKITAYQAAFQKQQERSRRQPHSFLITHLQTAKVLLAQQFQVSLDPVS